MKSALRQTAVLLVTSVDGKLRAIDARAAPYVLWELDLGGPMVTSWQEPVSRLEAAESGAYQHLIPTLDGSLLVQSPDGVDESIYDVETLFKKAPFMEAPGTFVTGSRTTQIFVVDAHSGERVATLAEGEDLDPGQPGMLYLGRVTYAVRGFDIRSGMRESWNFTYSQLVDMHDFGGGADEDPPLRFRSSQAGDLVAHGSGALAGAAAPVIGDLGSPVTGVFEVGGVMNSGEQSPGGIGFLRTMPLGHGSDEVLELPFAEFGSTERGGLYGMVVEPFALPQRSMDRGKGGGAAQIAKYPSDVQLLPPPNQRGSTPLLPAAAGVAQRPTAASIDPLRAPNALVPAPDSPHAPPASTGMIDVLNSGSTDCRAGARHYPLCLASARFPLPTRSAKRAAAAAAAAGRYPPAGSLTIGDAAAGAIGMGPTVDGLRGGVVRRLTAELGLNRAIMGVVLVLLALGAAATYLSRASSNVRKLEGLLLKNEEERRRVAEDMRRLEARGGGPLAPGDAAARERASLERLVAQAEQAVAKGAAGAPGDDQLRRHVRSALEVLQLPAAATAAGDGDGGDGDGDGDGARGEEARRAAVLRARVGVLRGVAERYRSRRASAEVPAAVVDGDRRELVDALAALRLAGELEEERELVAQVMGLIGADDNGGGGGASGGVDGEGRLIVGALRVDLEEILGYGSCGTVVYRGLLERRPVAVKRMLRAFQDAQVEREIQLLIESDGHPNVVRYFVRESTPEFVYLALQLCSLSLEDAVRRVAAARASAGAFAPAAPARAAGAAGPMPPAPIREALRQIAAGVAHLHALRIVHRDLKPQNILLASNSGAGEDDAEAPCDGDASWLEGYTLMISDMGLGKLLEAGQSSFGLPSHRGASARLGRSTASRASIAGSVGWQAPEVLQAKLQMTAADAQAAPPAAAAAAEPRAEEGEEGEGAGALPMYRRTQAVDVFSLGCVFHYVLVPLRHPFGEAYSREAHILSSASAPELPALGAWPLAQALVRWMLAPDPAERPSAAMVLSHPLFWSDQERLDFLVDLSDRVEQEDDMGPVSLLLEGDARGVLGGAAWDRKIHASILADGGKYRSYDATTVRDLLRLIRNKRHHHNELPPAIKKLLSPLPGGFLRYFEARFPKLLRHCFDVALTAYAHEPALARHMAAYADTFAPRSRLWRRRSKPSAAAAPAAAVEGSGVTMYEGSGMARAAGSRGWWRDAAHWQAGGGRRQRPSNLQRNVDDARYRTRLCQTWVSNAEDRCAMRRRGKCDFAHGPAELRVKENRKNRWGRYVDRRGGCDNPNASGGEDTLGAALRNERKTMGRAARGAADARDAGGAPQGKGERRRPAGRAGQDSPVGSASPRRPPAAPAPGADGFPALSLGAAAAAAEEQAPAPKPSNPPATGGGSWASKLQKAKPAPEGSAAAAAAAAPAPEAAAAPAPAKAAPGAGAAAGAGPAAMGSWAKRLQPS